MRRRSLTGPLLLLIIGGLFLWSNLRPDAPVWYLIAQNWPFLLIGWGVIRLLEVIFQNDDNPYHRGSFSGGEIVLIVFICIIGMASWQAHEWGFHFRNSNFENWFGEQYEYPISASAPATGMKRVVFENPHGNITITGTDTQQVAVSGHKLIRSITHSDADRANSLTPLELIPQGDRILVRTNEDRSPQNQRISADLTEITVPRGISVEIRGTTGGDYEINDLSADVELHANHAEVRLSKIGGNARIEVGRTDTIRAVEMKGKVDIQGQGSDLELEDIDGQVTVNGSYTGSLSFKKLTKPLQFEGARNTELNVQAVPGEITMDLSQFSASNVTGPMKLTTRSRDIHLEGVTKSLEVDTQRGDIEILPGLPMPSIEAHSGAGRIELALPEKASFQLDATAEHGDATNDFGPQIQAQSEGRMATLKGKVGDGPLVHITASRGSVEVRKSTNTPSDSSDKKSTTKSLRDSEIKL